MKTYRFAALVIATLGVILSTLYNQLLPNAYFIMGLSIGILFAILATTLVNRWLYRKVELEDKGATETILLAEGSTYFANFQGKSGKLFLTNKRLCFIEKGGLGKKSSPINIKRNHIKEVTPYNRAFLPAGFQIEVKDGAKHAFTVDDRAAWIKEIKQ